MKADEITTRLESKFSAKIKSKKLDAIDPFAVVDAADLLDVCRFLKEDSQLRFDILNCISGVDYLEPDPKKAPKAGFDPHTEVVYHLSSFTHRHRFVLKVMLPRWKDDKPGQLPEVPSVVSLWPAADWHEARARDAEEEGDATTALYHLDRRLALVPDDGPAVLRRMHQRLLVGDPAGAAADYARVGRLVGPGDRDVWCQTMTAVSRSRGQDTPAAWYAERPANANK